MKTIVEFLGTNHRTCDALLTSTRAAITQHDWDGACIRFKQFQHAMERHITMEAAVLFPAFETHTNNSTGPTQLMRMEHQQICAQIQCTARAVAQANYTLTLSLLANLNILIQQHNQKEEVMLYPMSDQMLGEECEHLIRAMPTI